MRPSYSPARKAFSALLLLVVGFACRAQNSTHSAHCSALKAHARAEAMFVADPAEDNYDMKYVKLDLQLSDTTTYITGDVQMLAQVSGPLLPVYAFELDTALTIDSVFVNGIQHPIASYGVVHTVTLAKPLLHNSLFTTRVCYHGTPFTSSSFFCGLANKSGVTYSLSQPYSARLWWPCKQSLLDKIDSVDTWVTVVDTLKAGCPGLLTAVTPVAPGFLRYEWKERYPIDYYLISVSVAKYMDYSYKMAFTGTKDSMLIQNYIYGNPAWLSYYKPELDSVGLLVNYYSSLFGRYPFWKEKYGHCLAPISGGMEHQTMTTIGYLYMPIVAHELAHQWFGDNVTCGSWRDIFVNEGFAGYSEYLYLDKFRGHKRAIADMVERQKFVMSEEGGSVFVDDTTDELRIFDSRLSYDKGACVIHMLRSLINNDSIFFDVLKTYQAKQGGRNGSANDITRITRMLAGDVVNGISVDTFMRQWIYGEGYPIYDISWNQNGNDIFVRLKQTTSAPASVPYFTLPVDITLGSGSKRVTTRLVNDRPDQVFHLNWPEALGSLAFDVDDWLTDSVQVIRRDMTLDTVPLPTVTASISPNPAHDGWQINDLSSGSSLTLTDVSGRVMWQAVANGVSMHLPAEQLASGIYLLRVNGEGRTGAVHKLVKE